MVKKIADAELEIMRILWRERRPMKVIELSGELGRRRGWSKSTTHTLVARLREKGFIEPSERGGVARWLPLISEDEYILAEARHVLGKFGSAKALALAMIRNGHLTEEDVAGLRGYFKPGGGGNAE
jgi:BlaI family penicillinase repressor